MCVCACVRVRARVRGCVRAFMYSAPSMLVCVLRARTQSREISSQNLRVFRRWPKHDSDSVARQTRSSSKSVQLLSESVNGLGFRRPGIGPSDAAPPRESPRPGTRQHGAGLHDVCYSSCHTLRCSVLWVGVGRSGPHLHAQEADHTACYSSCHTLRCRVLHVQVSTCTPKRPHPPLAPMTRSRVPSPTPLRFSACGRRRRGNRSL